MNKMIKITAMLLILIFVFSACRKEQESATNTEQKEESVSHVATAETAETESVVESGENWGLIEETEPSDTKPSETETVETKPTETEPTETAPTETAPTETAPTETKPTESKPVNPESGKITYEQYINMTAEQQQAFFEQFSSVDEYLAWYDAALAEYERNNEYINVNGGNIDIGEIMGQ